jgi:large subunit ribosomal protein L31
MKAGIHPTIHAKATATCASCATKFTIPSTVEEVSVERCSQCHWVYTGKEQKLSSGGRVDRFRKRMEQSAKIKKD